MGTTKTNEVTRAFIFDSFCAQAHAVREESYGCEIAPTQGQASRPDAPFGRKKAIPSALVHSSSARGAVKLHLSQAPRLVADGIYIASIQPRAGKSLAALGLMELASRRVERLGFFRPVVNGAAMDDREIKLMHARYALRDPIDASSGGPYEEARAMAGADQSDELLARILHRYEELQSKCEFVVCEGTDYSGVGAAFEFEFNARVAAHLGCPVFFVANGQGRTPAELVEDVRSARRAFEREDCLIVATLINRVAPEQVDEVKRSFAGDWNGQEPVYVVPEDDALGYPTLGEVMSALDGTLLFGDEHRLRSPARGFVVPIG